MFKFVDSDGYQAYKREPVIRYVFVPAVVGFLFMLVSMMLDTLTPTPTSVWALIWFASPFVTMTVPSLLPKSDYEGLTDIARHRVRDYKSLSKAERALLPKNTLNYIKTEDSDTLRLFDKAYREIISTRPNVSPTIMKAQEELGQAVSDLSIRNETYREFN